MKKIIIFLNGRHSKSVLRVKTQEVLFPFVQKTREHHHDTTLIFAADNGFKRVLSEKIKFSKLFLFGDFDSLSPKHLKKCKQDKNIVLNLLPKVKDISDFGAILDHILANFSNEHPFFVEIHGGLGKDRDHEYANIKEAEHFLKQSKHGGIVVFQGNIILSTISFALTHIRKKEFSIFFTPNCEFSIQNAIYSGNFSLSRPSHGLSNCVNTSPLIIERQSSPEIMTFIVR